MTITTELSELDECCRTGMLQWRCDMRDRLVIHYVLCDAICVYAICYMCICVMLYVICDMRDTHNAAVYHSTRIVYPNIPKLETPRFGPDSRRCRRRA